MARLTGIEPARMASEATALSIALQAHKFPHTVINNHTMLILCRQIKTIFRFKIAPNRQNMVNFKRDIMSISVLITNRCGMNTKIEIKK